MSNSDHASKLTFFAPVLLVDHCDTLEASSLPGLPVRARAFSAECLPAPVLVCLFGRPALPLFYLVSSRMIAVPSTAIDYLQRLLFPPYGD